MKLYDGLKAQASVIAPICAALGFLFPVDRDGLVVVYQEGDNYWRAESDVEIHKAWMPIGQTYQLRFGPRPSLRTAALASGAKQREKDFQCDSQSLEQLLSCFNRSLSLPECLSARHIGVREVKAGIELKVEFAEGDNVVGWARSGKFWTYIVGVELALTRTFDDVIRHFEDYWKVKTRHGDWCDTSPGGVKNVLQALGCTRLAAEEVMGNAIFDHWREVSIPFAPEYPDGPGSRKWNRKAPQLKYQPSPGLHPTWDRLMTHLGRDLNEAVTAANLTGIQTGSDYLIGWLAAIIRNPLCRLPYLFFHGEQDTGKSSFWESFELLVTGGVVKADRALTSSSGFNSELEGAILAVIEEVDLSTSPIAYARLKDSVTALDLSIRPLYCNPRTSPNYTHWIQCSNSWDACPVVVGDSRVVSIQVYPLEQQIPKDLLRSRLQEEAPHFTKTLLDFPLPKPIGRLALPPIETASKRMIQELNKPTLARVIDELLANANEWQGSTSKLRAIDSGCPSDLRNLKRELHRIDLHLKASKVAYDFPPRRRDGQQVRFYRTVA